MKIQNKSEIVEFFKVIKTINRQATESSTISYYTEYSNIIITVTKKNVTKTIETISSQPNKKIIHLSATNYFMNTVLPTLLKNYQIAKKITPSNQPNWLTEIPTDHYLTVNHVYENHKFKTIFELATSNLEESNLPIYQLSKPEIDNLNQTILIAASNKTEPKNHQEYNNQIAGIVDSSVTQKLNQSLSWKNPYVSQKLISPVINQKQVKTKLLLDSIKTTYQKTLNLIKNDTDLMQINNVPAIDVIRENILTTMDIQNNTPNKTTASRFKLGVIYYNHKGYNNPRRLSQKYSQQKYNIYNKSLTFLNLNDLNDTTPIADQLPRSIENTLKRSIIIRISRLVRNYLSQNLKIDATKSKPQLIWSKSINPDIKHRFLSRFKQLQLNQLTTNHFMKYSQPQLYKLLMPTIKLTLTDTTQDTRQHDQYQFAYKIAIVDKLATYQNSKLEFIYTDNNKIIRVTTHNQHYLTVKKMTNIKDQFDGKPILTKTGNIEYGTNLNTIYRSNDKPNQLIGAQIPSTSLIQTIDTEPYALHHLNPIINAIDKINAIKVISQPTITTIIDNPKKDTRQPVMPTNMQPLIKELFIDDIKTVPTDIVSEFILTNHPGYLARQQMPYLIAQSKITHAKKTKLIDTHNNFTNIATNLNNFVNKQKIHNVNGQATIYVYVKDTDQIYKLILTNK